MENKLNNSLASKLVQVMNDCSYVAKNGTNSFHGYKYATCADVLDKVNASLVKHGIASLARPELIDMVDVTTAKGNVEKLATVMITITLIDSETGEQLEITGLGTGQDNGDKAVMKAETAAIKYAWILSLSISTGDDPEADSGTDERMVRGQQVELEQHQTTQAIPRNTTKPVRAKSQSLTCSVCGAPISEKVYSYSMKKYGQPLCMRCQHDANVVA